MLRSMTASASSSSASSSGFSFYSRSPRARGAGATPGSVTTPSGKLLLAVPTRAAANAADQQAGDGPFVLMRPPLAPDDIQQASSSWLYSVLFADVLALVLLLIEASWIEAHRTADLFACGFAGLAIATFGFGGLYRRSPLALTLLAIACFVQLVYGLLAIHRTLPQLVHTLLQLVLISGTLTLRRSLMPTWFSSTGRPLRPAAAA